jgi:tellurium resistance protein TerZ
LVNIGNLTNTGIQHSGDVLVGNTEGDDGLNSEIDKVNLNQRPANVNQVIFTLNS